MSAILILSFQLLFLIFIILAGSRIRSTLDFGLVTLSINSLRPDDSAIYTCKAVNLLGEAVSTCTLKIADRHWLISKPQHPEALPYINALEQPKVESREYSEPLFEGPAFISHLNNIECKENDNVRFECRVEPAKDSTLKIDWYKNGMPLPSGSRFKSNYDFGYVSLDIKEAYPEDSGIYTCKATNSKGQAATTGSLRCAGKHGFPYARKMLESVLNYLHFQVNQQFIGKPNIHKVLPA